MKTDNELESRIAELETKTMFQDDLIERLNQSIIDHQKDITRLTRIIESMNAQLEDLRQPSVIDASQETPPPHY